MNKIFSKEIGSDIIKLGFYQVIGGAIGIFLIIWSIYRSVLLSGSTVLVYLFMLLFFLCSLYCGILCIKLNRTALKYSFINQCFQIIGFAFFGFAFKYVAGFYLTFELDLTNSIDFGFGAGVSKLYLSINSEPERIELTFNIVAVAMVLWIEKLMRKIKTEEEIMKASSIGDQD